MERTEILSLFKNTPADGTEITVCGWAKNIRDSKNIGFIDVYKRQASAHPRRPWRQQPAWKERHRRLRSAKSC